MEYDLLLGADDESLELMDGELERWSNGNPDGVLEGGNEGIEDGFFEGITLNDILGGCAGPTLRVSVGLMDGVFDG